VKLFHLRQTSMDGDARQTARELLRILSLVCIAYGILRALSGIEFPLIETALFFLPPLDPRDSALHGLVYLMIGIVFLAVSFAARRRGRR